MHKNLFPRAVASAAGALACLTLFAPSAANAQNLLTNGSFENIASTYTDNEGGGDSLTVGSTSIPGWTTNIQELAWLEVGNPYGLTPSNGSFFLDLTGYHDSTPYGGVTQTLTTVVGQSYVLSFDLGSDQSNGAFSGPMSALASAGSTSQTLTFSAAANSTGNQWGTVSLPFVATSTSTVISITGTSSAGGQYLGLDNAIVTASAGAPEPSALGLLASAAPMLGLVGVVVRRRKG